MDAKVITITDEHCKTCIQYFHVYRCVTCMTYLLPTYAGMDCDSSDEHQLFQRVRRQRTDMWGPVLTLDALQR